jgi:hypothetical protein
MVVEHYSDLQDDTGQMDITAFWCTSCGEVIDPTILRNRENPAPDLLYGTKYRKFAQRVGESDSSAAAVPDDARVEEASQEE